jgi:predicted amidophosphoribosyltransferase
MTAFIIVTLALCLYLLPTFAAVGRKHRNAGAICALNLLVGWTVLGWIVAMVWSMTANTAQPAAATARHIPCPECREPILPGARRCKHCGSVLGGPPPGQHACPDCGRHAPASEKYCPSCGHAMQPA